MGGESVINIDDPAIKILDEEMVKNVVSTLLLC